MYLKILLSGAPPIPQFFLNPPQTTKQEHQLCTRKQPQNNAQLYNIIFLFWTSLGYRSMAKSLKRMWLSISRKLCCCPWGHKNLWTLNMEPRMTFPRKPAKSLQKLCRQNFIWMEPTLSTMGRVIVALLGHQACSDSKLIVEINITSIFLFLKNENDVL